jgi:hypothetical protein
VNLLEINKLAKYIEDNSAEHIKKIVATNKQILKEIAEQNTKRNEDGLTVIREDDEWRN